MAWISSKGGPERQEHLADLGEIKPFMLKGGASRTDPLPGWGRGAV